MPPSVDDDGQRIAVVAEALYLANLTLAPVLGFILLLWLYVRLAPQASALARCHLRQGIFGSLWAGALLVLLNAIILLLGGYHSPSTLITIFLYFISCHSWLILLGMVGLAKALAGKPFIYPLIGVHCDG